MPPRARLYWIVLQGAAIAAGIYAGIRFFETISS